MYCQVSSRSMYDMQELRSIVQKMHRNPKLLTDGWSKYLYFLEEYFPTMRNDPSILMLFVVEDCARCPLGLLVTITDILQRTHKYVTLEDYRRVSVAIAMQPVDRTAAYLSVACLDQVSPLSEEEKCTLVNGEAAIWADYLRPEENEAIRGSFDSCMALLNQRVGHVPHEYPMTPETALRIAAAVSHLVAWDTMHPKVRLDKTRAKKNIASVFRQKISNSTVRPLVFALVAPYRWMHLARKTLDPRAEQFADQYIKMALVCCGKKSARLDLLTMNVLSVLMGRIPEESAADFLSDIPPCHPNEIPDYPRAFPMPEVSQDRHTRRGKFLIDTTTSLENHCKKRGLRLPENIEYSHGPPAHFTKQGFEEFMEHIQSCEDQTSDGKQPAFKEKALSMYRSLPKRVNKKRLEILKRRLNIIARDPRKRAASKCKDKKDSSNSYKKRKTFVVQ